MRRLKIVFIIISLILAAWLMGMVLYMDQLTDQVAVYNEQEHVVNGAFVDPLIKDTSMAGSAGEVRLNSKFRGGSADKWKKEQMVMMHGFADLTGAVYDMNVINDSGKIVSDWVIRQDFHQDCYINNAWSGTVEIHQFDKDGIEHVQTLDMSSVDRDSLELKYEKRGTDILINLHEGDYLFYYPNEEVHETPIEPDDGKNSVSNIGIIYYYWEGGWTDTTGMDLSDSTLTYKYNMTVQQCEGYDTLLSVVWLWAVCVGVFFFSGLIITLDYRKLAEREEFIDEVLTVFTHFVDAKDPYTKGHSNRVAEYSRAIANAMGMSETRCKNVYYIALLHDVGKCYIDDKILKKPDKLTREEFEEIKKHTSLGARMLEDFKSMPEIYNGALYHHERYDRKGYPTGKAGEDIPLIARIICVADSFDAMNSNRCYRPRLTGEVIRSEIINNAGTQFDPKIAEIFIKLLDTGVIDFDVRADGADS